MSRIKRHKLTKKLNKKTVKKKKMSKEMIFTLALGGLLIFSIFGIMFSGYASGNEKRPYKSYEFKKSQLGWNVEINGKNYVFNYHPADLEDLKIDKNVTEKLKNAQVVQITFNPNNRNVQVYETAKFEISKFLTENNVYVTPGVSEIAPKYEGQPIITCENATSSIPVIDIRESNVTSVYMEGDCIILEAEKYDVPPLIDRVSYAILGVIE